MSNSHLFLKSGFLNVPLENGIGRYVCQLQRIVLKFCKYSGGSRGMRDFLEHDLIDMARNHSGTVIYTKPRRHRAPVIVAEYLDGSRKWMPCNDMTHEEVARWISTLIGASNGETIRYRKLASTKYPSIQGPWNPFDSLPAKSEKQLPSEAYIKLIEIAKKQGVKTDFNPY